MASADCPRPAAAVFVNEGAMPEAMPPCNKGLCAFKVQVTSTLVL